MIHDFEQSFWQIMEKGLGNEPLFTWYNADGVLSALNDEVKLHITPASECVAFSNDQEIFFHRGVSVSCLERGLGARSDNNTILGNVVTKNLWHCAIIGGKSKTLLRQISETSGIKRCTYYLVAAYKFLSCYVEGGHPSEISFLASASQKVSYVIRGDSMSNFELCVASVAPSSQ